MYRKYRKMAQAYNRVLVHLKLKEEQQYRKAYFTQSIMGAFNISGDVADVYARMVGNKLLISNELINPNDKPVKIKRPNFCPITNMTKEHINELPRETMERGVDVGAAMLLESCDGKILLIRRAAHLRTFPGIWVPPGGHVEENESLYQGAAREMEEESGLDIAPDICDQDVLVNPTLALWESVFPPKLSAGLPRRHHIVTYVHAKLIPPYTADVMTNKLKLDPGEVGAAAWFTQDMVASIVQADEEQRQEVKNTYTQDYFSATSVTTGGEHKMEKVSSKILTATHTGEKDDSERISTGTKFALQEWLLRKTTPEKLNIT